ncbi:alpha/beta hydrolase [Bauldia sp.]|uniref:alpha/beta hydrolase n=1 Tax=Bauldia sp. TaxID=2575872 RepID=UPI003BAC5F3E
MTQPVAETVTVGPDARTIATLSRPGKSPGLIWLGGFASDMTGTKAEALDAFAARRGLAMTRFDYSGHGASGGTFAEGTISRWLEEARCVFDRTTGPQIVVGSSMGGWLALLLAQAHRDAVGAEASRLAGLVLIAPATDMTRTLMWEGMSEAERAALMETGAHQASSDYDDEGYLITRALIEDGDKHLFGDRLIETGCPVHIVQGVQDTDVPWQHATDLVSRLASDDVVLTLIKDGDHRLSRPEDIERIEAAIADIIAES